MYLPDSSVHENILSVHEVYCAMWCSLPTFKAERGAEFCFLIYCGPPLQSLKVPDGSEQGLGRD